MLYHLLHPLRVLWTERISLFWLIWIAITAIGIGLVVAFVPDRLSSPREPAEAAPRRWSSVDMIAMAFLCVVLGFYAASSLAWEDFTYYDNSHFTNETLRGRNVPLQIPVETGRFWPLGYQEFNFIRHITHSVSGYHAFRILELLVICGILLVFDEELRIAYRVTLIALALITPSILISFSGLIYAESNVILGLVCLAWSVKQFERTRTIGWGVAALICAQVTLYYKETAFLLILGFTAGRLLLRCREMDGPGWDFTRLKRPESRLDMCLALMGVLFLLYYFAAMSPIFGTGYRDQMPLPEVVTSYLKLDLLVWIFAAIVLIRLVQILRRRALPSPLWDGLALAGLGGFNGYLFLRMSSAYFLAPVDLIAVIYLGHLAISSMKSHRLSSRLGVAALALVIVSQDISLSAFRMYEAKNVTHAKAEMGRVIAAEYKNEPGKMRELFFPFATPFQIMEFASYLNYLGVPIEQAAAPSEASNTVTMFAKAVQTDGDSGYRGAFVCRLRKEPKPSDVIIILPDDPFQGEEPNSPSHEWIDPVFFYSPYPHVPIWLQTHWDKLRVVSPVFAHDRLPKGWLNASITIWK